jgi:DNA-binding NarL/FixJ family response regulator
MSVSDPLLFLVFLLLLTACLLLLGLLVRSILQHPRAQERRKTSARRLALDVPSLRVPPSHPADDSSDLWQKLTPRERQVALCAARGLSNAEISAALGIKPRTVEAHLQNIYDKLQVRSRTQLAHRFRDFVD